MTRLEELKWAWDESHKAWSEAYDARYEACEAFNEACVKADKDYKAYYAELEKQDD